MRAWDVVMVKVWITHVKETEIAASVESVEKCLNCMKSALILNLETVLFRGPEPSQKGCCC